MFKKEADLFKKMADMFKKRGQFLDVRLLVFRPQTAYEITASDWSIPKVDPKVRIRVRIDQSEAAISWAVWGANYILLISKFSKKNSPKILKNKIGKKFEHSFDR